MARTFKVFASYLLFKEVLADPLGRLYRAGEFDAGGIRRTVWLRVFDRPEVPSDEITAAFDRARSIASILQSANIAAGFDCVAENDAPAIAYDYVASQPLSGVFQRVAEEQFPIPVDNALLIVEKIALALSGALTVEIDGGRVVHGFLHPGLIFVSNDGEGIVSGFGFGDQLLGLIDDEGSKSFVHPYLAPEVLVTRTASRHGDVYSLGAILFQLLSGSALPADPEKRSQAVAEAHLAYDDEPMPEDIKALLLQALADRPEDRFSSASDFKKKLDRLLYGGAYSPTTFNLALFIDRLFRADIESEDEERAEETGVDVRPYLAPVVEPTPELVNDSGTARPMDGNRKFLWIGLGSAAAIVAAIAITVFTFTREPAAPALPSTPTAAEISAQRQAQEEKMRELAQGLVAEMMAEKEEEIRTELLDRQTKIEDLQKKLQASERRAEQGQLTSEDQRRQEELQQQIAAEEEAQRINEAELEAERLRVEEEARSQAAALQTATAVVKEEAQRMAAITPTTVPPAPTTVSESTIPVAETGVVDVSELDLLPVVIKEEKVDWPQAARFSKRQGVVILQATVDANGLVEDVTVLRVDDEEFGIPEAVMNAVMRYRFKPGVKDGVRVKTHATVTKAYKFIVR